MMADDTTDTDTNTTAKSSAADDTTTPTTESPVANCDCSENGDYDDNDPNNNVASQDGRTVATATAAVQDSTAPMMVAKAKDSTPKGAAVTGTTPKVTEAASYIVVAASTTAEAETTSPMAAAQKTTATANALATTTIAKALASILQVIY